MFKNLNHSYDQQIHAPRVTYNRMDCVRKKVVIRHGLHLKITLIALAHEISLISIPIDVHNYQYLGAWIVQ